MGTYAVAVSRNETATIYVEADDAPSAERIASAEAESNWEGDTINIQVDDVSELTGPEANAAAVHVVREEPSNG